MQDWIALKCLRIILRGPIIKKLAGGLQRPPPPPQPPSWGTRTLRVLVNAALYIFSSDKNREKLSEFHSGFPVGTLSLGVSSLGESCLGVSSTERELQATIMIIYNYVS